MFKNYLKIAWRNLVKNKAHSFINITGLSVGMAVAVLTSLWVWDELSYDRNFKNYDRIVQLMQHQTLNGNVLTQTAMPIPLAATLLESNKEDFKHVVLSTWTFSFVVSYADKKLIWEGNFMQPDATEMLSLKMLKGSRSGLGDPSSVLLSAKLARALFGDADPMFKMVKLNSRFMAKVTGVYEDMPANSSFSSLGLIAPWDRYVESAPWVKDAATRWGNNSFQIFAQLNPGVDIRKVENSIRDIKLKNIRAQGDMVGASFKPVLFLNPMSGWHLYSEFKQGINTGGAIQFVWMFGTIGVFVLLLACINFMNLSTARSEKRAKEVGIRKTVGSFRRQIIFQFFAESLMITFFAFLLSLGFARLVMPWFNEVAGKNLSLMWGNVPFWVAGIGFTLVTGIIAGSYPAFYLSSFRPVKVLKGTFKAGRLAALPRKVLVVLQFTVSVTLIIGTIMVFRQVQFTKNRSVGYERTGLLHAEMKTDLIHENFSAIRNDLMYSGTIIEIAESGSPLTDVYSNNSGFKWRGKPPGLQDDFAYIPVSADFGKVAGWTVVKGRDFDGTNLSDSSAIILNESAVKFMNFKDPIGEIVEAGKRYTVIGVVKDMVMSSPYEPVKTTVFPLLNYPGDVLNIRLNPQISTRKALTKIQSVLKEYDPDSPFDYKFTDDEYAKKFWAEERIGKLAGLFTILAVFISCMGLFGMASFMAEQRIKEIGVRKVLGASVFSLWRLMSRDFVTLVSISLLLAIPIAYYFMKGWLQNYKYHAELSWWIFAMTALSAILITLLTVSYQSIKAALSNPVDSLKTE